MSSTVLGKRARTSTSAALDNQRAKRQTITAIYDEEHDNPFQTRGSRTCRQASRSLSPDPLRSVLLGQEVRPVSISCTFKSKVDELEFLNDENVTPLQIRTPQTPRHRDALSKKQPVTPRHRVAISTKLLTPQTTRTPASISSQTVYNSARLLFSHSSDPGRLVGRDDERTELSEFVTKCIASNSGDCTYVSGPPGTGKSALVTEVLNSIPDSATLKKAYINCMSMRNSKDVCANLLDAFNEEGQTSAGDEQQILQTMFVQGDSRILHVVVLDEMDHVLSLDVELMYRLFDWSLQKSSRLVLIGIANALDLTDRFLPRLKARNLKPRLLPFLPYTASQIKAVVITRLKSLLPAASPTPDYVPFLHPAAIELCSRKVAGHTGDLRKALDICRRAIDLVESETKQKCQQVIESQYPCSPTKKVLGENNNLASPSPTKQTAIQSLKLLTAENAPRASISHVNKVTSSTFGNGATQRLKTLNLQQKAALCALVALEKRKRAAATNVMATPSKSSHVAPNIKALYDSYTMLCKRDAILHPLTSVEFRDVIGSLETLSLVSAVDGKSGSFIMPNTPSKRGRKSGFGGGVGSGDDKRIGSCVSERELEQAVEGVGSGILKSILSGDGL